MSSQAPLAERTESRGRWQVSLADLSFFVLAAGLGVSIVRGARDVWATRATGTMGTSPVPFARTAGVAIAVAAVWLAMILGRRMISILRGRRSGMAAGWRALVAPLAWRAAALVLLLGFATREGWILRVDYKTFNTRSSPEAGWSNWYELREMLIPLCAILVMIGLTLGMGAVLPFGRSDPGKRRPYWLFVPLAAVAGILFLGLPNGWLSVITQLILLALEAVNNAMPPPHRAGPDGLSVRLLRAGIGAIPAAFACLGLALVVARDFELARQNEPWATTRGGWVLRILSLVTAAAMGAVVALILVPAVSPHWFNGYRQVLQPEIVLMVLCGFGMLSAGLAARTLAPPAFREKTGRTAQLVAIVIPSVMLMIVLLLALRYLPSSTQLDAGVPAIVGRFCDWVREIPAWLFGLAPDSAQANFAEWLEPERLAWVLAIAALGFFVLQLAFPRPGGDQPAPFDAVAGSPGRLAWFVWLTTALTAVCVISMPTLLLLGQVIVHIRFHIDRWMVDGWPSPF